MPTKKAAWTLSQGKRAAVLSGDAAGPKFRELVERYQREDTAHLRHSSLSSNESRIKRVILPLALYRLGRSSRAVSSWPIREPHKSHWCVESNNHGIAKG
jgi:hypothetical protein